MKRSYLLMAALTLLLAGCSSTADTDPTATPLTWAAPTDTQAEEPAKEGETSPEPSETTETEPTEQAAKTETQLESKEESAESEAQLESEEGSAEPEKQSAEEEGSTESQEAEQEPNAKEAVEPEKLDDQPSEITFLEHIVRWGENLYRIGLHYGVDWKLIAEHNGLGDGDDIEAGWVLFIPVQQSDSDNTLPFVHTVQPGENLFRIGLKYGLSWTAIAQANNLLNANAIYAGQQLIIPAASPTVP